MSLQWCLQNPSLLKSSLQGYQAFCPWTFLKTSEDNYSTLFHQTAPEPLLGRRFETWVQIALQANPNISQLISHRQYFLKDLNFNSKDLTSLQFLNPSQRDYYLKSQSLAKTSQEQTFGEIDYVFNHQEHLLHLEVAFKFYLYQPNLGEWIGPHRKDTLNKKLHQLLNHQLFWPQFLYESLFSTYWVQGMLFYPWDPELTGDQQLNLNQKVQSLFEETAHQNSSINPEHAQGYYVFERHLDAFKNCIRQFFKSHSKFKNPNFYILPKTFWLQSSWTHEELSSAPHHLAHESRMKHPSEPHSYCMVYAHPVDSDTSPTIYHELQRFFVVEDNWNDIPLFKK